MSPPRLHLTYACAPTTTRGRGVHLGGHHDAKSGANTLVYCNGKSVILRSLDDPTQVVVYSEHAHNTTVARISPNGEWVASGDVSGSVRIWARRAESNHVLKFELRAIAGSIDDIEWSPDGQRILVSGDGKGSQFVRCFIWDSGNNVGEFDGHSRRVLSCTFRPVRPFRIATGGEDRLVNFYEGPPFRLSLSHSDHTNFVNCVRFSPDGSAFVTVGSGLMGPLLFHGKTGAKIGALPGAKEGGHSGSIYAACWSPDGKQLLTVSADQTAKIWDIDLGGEDGAGAGGRVNTTFTFSSNGTEGAATTGTDHMQMACIWLPNHIVTLSLNGDLHYLSSASPSRPIRTLFGHMKLVSAMVIGPPAEEGEERDLYSSSYEGGVLRWRVGKGGIARLTGKELEGGVVQMAIGGKDLLTCSLDDKLRRSALPNAGDAASLPPDSPSASPDSTALPPLSNGHAEVLSVPLSSQPRGLTTTRGKPSLAVAITDRTIALLRDSVSAISVTQLSYDATAIALSPDGETVVVGGADGKLRVYKFVSEAEAEGCLQETAVLERHRSAVRAISFSPDGSLLASGDQKPEAVVWETATWQARKASLLYHTARIACLAWSPDGTHLATGSLDTSICVWEVAKPPSSRTTVRHAHPGGLTALAFFSDTTLLSAGDDACIRQWVLER
eukprot:TRINITY_DN1085_c0_g1_i3.p1 TRINITY_DN1085_c0_g1~~TRINITY_DN1085_c0_g1_i3.p1  ORF type:complete len:669 (+),score=90.06 TRINITY_DN1085_c0_g1_i3:60-2066(+)